MYTELVIKESANRGYVEYYFNGQRLREYNANKLGLSILPNKARTKADKARLLKKLKFELEKALEKGWAPTTPAIVVEASLTLEESIQKIAHSKLTGNLPVIDKTDMGDPSFFVEVKAEDVPGGRGC